MPAPGTLLFGDDDDIFCGDNHCTYIFYETSTETLNDPDAIPVAVATDRSANAAAECSSHRVVQGGNGTSATVTIEVGSRDVEIAMPSRSRPETSTYMTDTSDSCGDGCSIVSVFEASSTEPWFYNCSVRLGPVVNATRSEHRLGTNLARLATSAIALQGYGASGNVQSMTYPSASVFGTPLNGSAETMGYLISRFTIGCLSTVVESNEDIIVDGQAPKVGQKLNVSHWSIIHLVLWLTASLQLLLSVLATVVSERVIVPESDPLAEARVLRTMVASTSSHDENGFKSQENSSGKTNSVWIYRNRHVGDGLYDLYMEETSGAT